VVKFAPNAPVEVALKFALPGKIISTRSGERVLYTLADDRAMFLDLPVARKVEDLGVNVREKFFICRPPSSKKDAEWTVWLSPEAEKARAEVEMGRNPQQKFSAQQEFAPLERQTQKSVELTKPGKLGELGDGTFAVPAGASAGTPAPVQSGTQNGHRTSDNGNSSTNGRNGNGTDGNGMPKHPEPSGPPAWAESLLGQANALVDVYAAALGNASTKHGNQVKPEDVRSLLVTVFIQRSKAASYGA
jgi:hypothetical protein